MDKFKSMEQRFIMIIIGIGLFLTGVIFDLGALSGVMIGFGLVTVILNLVMNLYELKKMEEK